MIRKATAVSLVIAACWAALVVACRHNDAVLTTTPRPYTLQLPDNFPPVQYDFSNNPLTEEGIALGRTIFYDSRLSADSLVSCAFCHQQYAAFGHYDHALSHGVYGRIGVRTVPSIFNMIWSKSFMWDGGVINLDMQPLTPLTDHNEMGEDLPTLLLHMQADARYRKLFKAAFGTEEITSQRMFRAVIQFVATLNSFQSKYDSVKAGTASFSLEEAAGYQIFQQHCAACHKEPLFTDGSFRNNGLPVQPALNDSGRMRITGNPADYLKFKVPSLRNIIRTEPYMHDGRFFDIFNVFDHYDHGIVQSATLDPLLKDGIPLNSGQQRQLYLFLNTLTDYKLLNDKTLADPATPQ
ncbi:MAG TPA: cytochrome c peroxidase [Chitinophaga sp.]